MINEVEKFSRCDGFASVPSRSCRLIGDHRIRTACTRCPPSGDGRLWMATACISSARPHCGTQRLWASSRSGSNTWTNEGFLIDRVSVDGDQKISLRAPTTRPMSPLVMPGQIGSEITRSYSRAATGRSSGCHPHVRGSYGWRWSGMKCTLVPIPAFLRAVMTASRSIRSGSSRSRTTNRCHAWEPSSGRSGDRGDREIGNGRPCDSADDRAPLVQELLGSAEL